MPAQSGVPSPYAAGYSETFKAGLERVVLPETAKCKGCNKVKSVDKYSNKQLVDLRHHVYTSGEPALSRSGIIKCRDCTGTQKLELYCYLCDQTKSLDDFSKTHRRRPDSARCMECMNKVMATEPKTERTELDDEDHSAYLTIQETNVGQMSRPNVDENKPSKMLHNEGSGNLLSEIEDFVAAPNSSNVGGTGTNKPGGVWIEQGRRGATGPLNSGKPSASLEKAQAPGRSESVATSGAYSGWGIGPSNNSNQVKAEKNSNFAKSPGRKVPVGQHTGLVPGGYGGAPKDVTHPDVHPHRHFNDDDDDEELDPSDFL